VAGESVDVIMTRHQSRTVAVFGAYGHTGRFVAAELHRRGIAAILSGRDEGCAPRNTGVRAREGGTRRRGEPPPFWFMRLSFVESREKIDKNRTRDRTVVRLLFL
jgi:hypothetical protein